VAETGRAKLTKIRRRTWDLKQRQHKVVNVLALTEILSNYTV